MNIFAEISMVLAAVVIPWLARALWFRELHEIRPRDIPKKLEENLRATVVSDEAKARAEAERELNAYLNG